MSEIQYSTTGLTERDVKISFWEMAFVDPHDKSRVTSQQELQAITNHVWAGLGLKAPPTCAFEEPMDLAMASASRTRLTLFGPQSTSTVLHEIAHAANQTLDMSEGWRKPYEPESHGPNWLGIYVKLLGEYIPGLNFFYLHGSLKDIGLEAALNPVIVAAMDFDSRKR